MLTLTITTMLEVSTMRFISNFERPSSRCKKNTPAILRAARIALAVWLLAAGSALPAAAQAQAQAQVSSQQSGTAPATGSAAPSDEADPPPDDSPETMLPHFKDTRFWLSGQMNFI